MAETRFARPIPLHSPHHHSHHHYPKSHLPHSLATVFHSHLPCPPTHRVPRFVTSFVSQSSLTVRSGDCQRDILSPSSVRSYWKPSPAESLGSLCRHTGSPISSSSRVWHWATRGPGRKSTKSASPNPPTRPPLPHRLVQLDCRIGGDRAAPLISRLATISAALVGPLLMGRGIGHPFHPPLWPGMGRGEASPLPTEKPGRGEGFNWRLLAWINGGGWKRALCFPSPSPPSHLRGLGPPRVRELGSVPSVGAPANLPPPPLPWLGGRKLGAPGAGSQSSLWRLLQ